jgi:putative flippase GtrA
MKLARAFVLYNLVAVGSAIADWVVFLALQAAGLPLVPRQVGGRLAGGLFSFACNRRAMQSGEGRGVLVQGRRFVLLYVFSLGLSIAVLSGLVAAGVSVYASKVVADGTCFLVNFAVMRGYVFRATAGITHRLRTAVLARRQAA